MNEIIMIPAAEIYPHPENPRMQLGDLTELSESIRKNGIMQNLTVVPGHFMSKEEWVKEARAEGADKVSAEASYRLADAWVSEGYTVVIGHRRLAAAKMAGLTVLPCVVSEMDHREQISTMLEENMQRADLTVYEQAQGFQMMMDLGYKAEEISEKTGFSETTVRRRLKMAELDKDTFQKAVGKQITMDDLDRLGQLDSVKERNALLKEYGENNFDWKLNRAIKVQKAAKVRKAAHKMLQEAQIEKVPDKEQYAVYSSGYESLGECKLYAWDGKSNIIPKLKEEGKLFYLEDDTEIRFYIKKKKQKAEPVKKSEQELEEARKRDLAWKTVDRSAETAAELREKFVEMITVSPKNAMRMMQWAMVAAFGCMMKYDTPTNTLKKRLEIQSYNTAEIMPDMYRKIMEMPQSKWPGLILMMFEGDWKGNKGKPPMFADGSRNWQMPKYRKSEMLEMCYEWLTEFGYSMSTEEIEMMSGTHPVFQTEVKT
jgi:ParB family chromosome partitioning protein